MMAYMGRQIANISDISNMPRGGPHASWLDRLLQTDRDEYLDRDDVDEGVKRSVIEALDVMGVLLREHERNAEQVLMEVATVADPRILELGAGHGQLSRKILEQHPTATVTVSDVNPHSVAAMAASDLGEHPRATVQTMDATAIDAPDRSFDVAVFALSFHHLPPPLASRVIAEGTRVADKLLIIDMSRWPSVLHVAKLATMAPFALVWPFAHDEFISSLRTYSPSAIQALAAYASPDIAVEFGPGSFDRQVVIARRDR